MNRREAVAAMASGPALAALRLGAAQAASPVASPLRRAAEDALIFGSPLNEMALTRAAQFANGLTVGRFEHKRAHSGPETRWVTAPNNDTLYSICWLDLSRGPAKVSIPPCGDRYFAVAFLDMYSNNHAVLSSRTLGGAGGVFTVVGPDDASTGREVIRSPTRWMWVTIRLLVSGEADLPAVHALPDRFVMTAPSAPAPPPPAPRDAPWDRYFASLDTLIRDDAPTASDTAMLRRMAPLGLGAGRFDPGRFGPAQVAEIQAGLADARRRVATLKGSGPMRNGWIYPRGDLGAFGQDYLYRAQVALAGLGALTSTRRFTRSRSQTTAR